MTDEKTDEKVETEVKHEKSPQEKAAEAEASESRSVKVERALAAYAHGLEHGAPRSETELATLRELLSE